MQSLKACLLVSLTFLLNSCVTGPMVCSSDAELSQFECTNSHVKKQVVSFSNSEGYRVYDLDSYQAFMNYCYTRNTVGIQPPKFTQCISHPDKLGIECSDQKCAFNSDENGILCKAAAPAYMIPYSSTNNFIALSQYNNSAVFSTCNIVMQ